MCLKKWMSGVGLLFMLLCITVCGRAQMNQRNSSQAQLPQRNIFKPYPEAYIRQVLPAPGQWNPFPTTAQEWHKILPDSIISIYIAKGDSALHKEFPAVSATGFLQFYRSKNSPQADQKYFDRRFQLFSLIMAESMEGKGRFNDKIADAVWAICEESSWAIPAHLQGLPNVDQPYVDLFAAETASLLAWTCYFVGDQLNRVSRQLKPRILSEINRRLFNPMLTANWPWIGNDNPNRVLNNWSPWIMSNYITVTLLLESDEDKRAAAIKRGMNTIDHYVNGLGNDGAINEGPIYWFPSVGCVFDALAVLYNASSGKIDLYRDPFLKKMAAYIYHTHIAGKYFVNIGDAAAKIDVDGAALYTFGKAISDSTLMALGNMAARDPSSIANNPVRIGFARRFASLLEMTACLQYQGKYTPSNDVWMPDIQMMCSRADNGFFMSAHGGNNGKSHNHNDAGDFVVYFNGQPLLIDAGRGSYTGRTFSGERYSLWFNTSGYHNLPELNGVQQKDGLKYAARNVRYNSNRKYSSLAMDIAGTYPAEAGITNLERTITLYKKGGVELRDHYSMKIAAPVTQHFMTVCKTDISSPGSIVFTLPDATKVELLYDASSWYAEIQAVELNQPEDEELKATWAGQTIQRISIRSKRPMREGNASFRIQSIARRCKNSSFFLRDTSTSDPSDIATTPPSPLVYFTT